MYNDALHTVHKNIIVYIKYSASRQGWVQIHICDQIKILLSQIKYIAFPDFNSNFQYIAICYSSTAILEIWFQYSVL